MTYSSSLTDEEWKLLEPLLPEILPPKKQTRPSDWTKREIIEMLTNNINFFKAKSEDLPLTTILLDHGYHLEKIQKALEEEYPEIMTKIRLELSPKPSKAEKEAQGKSGFVPVAMRWIVERSNAWMERCKSLAKNYEWSLENAKAKIDLCFARLALKRLAALQKEALA